MAYRNTPHGTTKHTPYYMLHGREMTLPTMQSLRAKLSTDVRESEHGPRLENLKSRLRTAYKIAREQGRRSHATNKHYFDKHAKHREFEVGDTVYLYNPAARRESQSNSDDLGLAHGGLQRRSPDYITRLSTNVVNGQWCTLTGLKRHTPQ